LRNTTIVTISYNHGYILSRAEEKYKGKRGSNAFFALEEILVAADFVKTLDRNGTVQKSRRGGGGCGTRLGPLSPRAAGDSCPFG